MTYRIILTAAVLASAAFAQTATPAVSYKEIKYPAPGTVRVPEPIRFQLPNGMRVLLVEDHELPTINVSAMIGPVGAGSQPARSASRRLRAP
jgi:zinc protease